MSAALYLVAAMAILGPSVLGQQTSWAKTGALSQEPSSSRVPTAADLQNQVNALSAQISAANRQLQYFQHQLSLATQQPQPLVAQLAAQQQQHQQHQQHQQQLQAIQPQAQAQQVALIPHQFYPPAQVAHQAAQTAPVDTQAAPVSTLVDNESPERQFSGQQPNLFFQPSGQQQPSSLRLMQQQSFQTQAEGTSTSATPTSIEPSAPVTNPLGQPEAALAQAPPASMRPPHSPAKNDDKFSIGLGVLSPGYTQKFGNTALDFNQDKNGFSFTLSNNGHNNQQSPQVHQRQLPK